MDQMHNAVTTGRWTKWILLLTTLLLVISTVETATTMTAQPSTPITEPSTAQTDDPTTATPVTSPSTTKSTQTTSKSTKLSTTTPVMTTPTTTITTSTTKTPTTTTILTTTTPITTAPITTATTPTTTSPTTTLTTTTATTPTTMSTTTMPTTTSTATIPTTTTLFTTLSTRATTPSTQPSPTTTNGTETSSESPTPSTGRDTTTKVAPACPPGFFYPPECKLRCMCRDSNETCDSRSGHCISGCRARLGGPGCFLPSGMKLDGDLPVVVVLGLLLTMALIAALGLFVLLIHITKGSPLAIKKQYREPGVGVENHAYEFPEMDVQYTGIERIRETDIQVITNPLGEGRFGDILPGKVQRGNRRIDVVFKTLKDGSSDLERNGLLAQLSLYTQLEPHPNIIQFFGLCRVADQLFAAFEFASNGNLRNFLRRNGMLENESKTSVHVISQTMLINFCIEIAQGMQYLTSKKVVHRELMARHVLVTKNFTCKVSGLSPTGRSEKNLPVRWMAPETLINGVFSHNTDVWSFGVVMWEVMSLGSQPYPSVSTSDLPNLLSGGYRMAAPDTCDAQVYDVMKSCWEEEPEGRRPFGELTTKLKYIMETGVDTTSITLEEDDEYYALSD